MGDVLFRDLTDQLLGLAFLVHNEIGPGLLEAVYEGAYCVELKRAGIPFERQKRFEVMYKGEFIGEYFADVVVDGKVLLEFKAVRRLTEVHDAQVINYLRLSGLNVGYLLNFAGLRLEWKRLACGGG